MTDEIITSASVINDTVYFGTDFGDIIRVLPDGTMDRTQNLFGSDYSVLGFTVCGSSLVCYLQQQTTNAAAVYTAPLNL